MSDHCKNNPQTAAACKSRHWLMRYRGFLLDPGTLFTFASGLLLILSVLLDPVGLYHDEADETGSILYLAAALVGSSNIWWSALQGIRERDFTADIPVTIATIAAIAIGEYSAAAVVAVLLLAGRAWVAVVLTVPGILTPVTGAMLHELSSIPVIPTP